MRRLLVMAWLLILGGGVCRAQEVGLLLGLRIQHDSARQNEPMKSTYRTLWVVAGPGHAALRAALPGLLVPRKTGFWRVGVTRQTSKHWTEDQVWATPFGTAPRLRPLDREMVNTTDGISATDLLFVGPDYLATETSNDGYAKGAAHPFAGTSLDVFPLDKLRRAAICPSAGYVYGKDGTKLYAVGMATIFGSGEQALHAGARAYRSTLKQDVREGLAEDAEETSWTLIRRQGHWVTRGRLNYSDEVHRGTFADFDVAVSPPESLTGPDRLSLSWEEIKRHVPAATDAMTSPEGTLLVVLTRTQVIVFPLHGTQVGAQILAAPLQSHSSPVMIQWAIGGSVRRWTNQVTSAR